MMKSLKWILPVFFLLFSSFIEAQKKEIKAKDFFTDERILDIKLTTDIKNLLTQKVSLKPVDAFITCKFPDSSIVEENIMLKQRGHFRKDHCYLSSLMLQFNNIATNQLAPLKSLKMVSGCWKNSIDEQFLFKEYLIYKIYNLLTDFSFRVRLMHVTYTDSKGKVKPYSQCAFVLEDIDGVAKRNKCLEKKLTRYSPTGTHSYQTTLLSVFQYMIGNADWSIPNYHNIKLLIPKKENYALPIPVAYDFDMSGLVNANYATPPPDLGIERVTQRVYRGFATTIEETQLVIDLMLQKEKEIFSIINGFDLLNQKNKKEMAYFLEEFFKTIKNNAEVKNIFITNARQE
ncbi:MAG: hypothetical protein ABI760_15945 [Ferruginibacter sp.]